MLCPFCCVYPFILALVCKFNPLDQCLAYTECYCTMVTTVELWCWHGVLSLLPLADPVQNVVQVLEKQYLEEKRSALEEQRMMYERELEQLRQQLSPERQHQHGSDQLSYTAQSVQQKVNLWTEERWECRSKNKEWMRNTNERGGALKGKVTKVSRNRDIVSKEMMESNVQDQALPSVRCYQCTYHCGNTTLQQGSNSI